MNQELSWERLTRLSLIIFIVNYFFSKFALNQLFINIKF